MEHQNIQDRQLLINHSGDQALNRSYSPRTAGPGWKFNADHCKLIELSLALVSMHSKRALVPLIFKRITGKKLIRILFRLASSPL